MTPKAVALSYRILVRAQAIKLHVTNILNTDWTRMLRSGIHTCFKPGEWIIAVKIINIIIIIIVLVSVEHKGKKR